MFTVTSSGNGPTWEAYLESLRAEIPRPETALLCNVCQHAYHDDWDESYCDVEGCECEGEGLNNGSTS